MIREKMSKILWDTKIAEPTALAPKALKLDWNRDADSYTRGRPIHYGNMGCRVSKEGYK